MSQRIMTFCDVHGARDEDVPGRPFHVAVGVDGPAPASATVIVDLCDVCAKPLEDLFVELREVGRERGRTRGHRRTRGTAATYAANDAGEYLCPVADCDRSFGSAQGVSTHVTRSHRS